jgi:hypothetical protein
VHDLVPVGSLGIARETMILAENARLNFALLPQQGVTWTSQLDQQPWFWQACQTKNWQSSKGLQATHKRRNPTVQVTNAIPPELSTTQLRATLLSSGFGWTIQPNIYMHKQLTANQQGERAVGESCGFVERWQGWLLGVLQSGSAGF